jgi:hypothetical protein
MTATVIRLPRASTAYHMACSACGVTMDAACDCGAPYMPVAQRAAEAIKANPTKSDRAIAKELGVSHMSVKRARETVTDVTVDEPQPRVGLDGKSRRMPVKPPIPDDEERPQNYRVASLLRVDVALNAAREAKWLWDRNHSVCTRAVCKEIADAARNAAEAWSAFASSLENLSND